MMIQVGFQWGCVVMQGLMVFMLTASLVSCYNVPMEEEEGEGEKGVKEMVENDQTSGVRVGDVDIETKI